MVTVMFGVATVTVLCLALTPNTVYIYISRLLLALKAALKEIGLNRTYYRGCILGHNSGCTAQVFQANTIILVHELLPRFY